MASIMISMRLLRRLSMWAGGGEVGGGQGGGFVVGLDVIFEGGPVCFGKVSGFAFGRVWGFCGQDDVDADAEVL
jgi:hypothetical protein